MQKSAANQLSNKVALVAGTRLVNFQADTYLAADLRRPQTELPGKLGRASAIYLNKISMVRSEPMKMFFVISNQLLLVESVKIIFLMLI